jgi:hypothetical protein
LQVSTNAYLANIRLPSKFVLELRHAGSMISLFLPLPELYFVLPQSRVDKSIRHFAPH